MSRVLVTEKLADAGVELLRRHADVDVETGWSPEELAERIGQYDALLIRSATKVTADLIARADKLKVIGRAGVGVNNVDVPAATKRGILVANAPQSNVVSAAEQTIALLLALARNLPQAHGSMSAGRWERSTLGGVEVYEKTLGVLGFGRIGQLVAERARGLGMRVVAYDPFVGAERYRELGVEKAEDSAAVYAEADFLTIHLPVTPDTEDWLDAEAFAQMKDGVRVLNVARGELLVEEALVAALDSGKVAGAALDVFRSEPYTEGPLFGRANVILTPHLGASTTEAQDRAGVQTAEQVVAALTGGVVTTAVNAPALAPEDLAALGPYVPLCRQLGRIGVALAAGSSVDRVEVELLGRIAERDTRLLVTSVLLGILAGHTEEEINAVNAPSIAEERGIEVVTTSNAAARDYTDLVRVRVTCGDESVRVVGTNLGRRNRPHLLEAWGHRFNLQLEDHLTVFRYSDVPGMIGTVGLRLGDAGINISSAAVGHRPDGANGGEAVMAVTTDVPVPDGVIASVLEADGFAAGRTVSLS